MNNSLLIVAAGLVVLSLGQLAALLGVLFRHAIPRAPFVFHGLLLLPMLITAGSCLAMAYMALSGRQQVAGLDGLVLLAVFFICEAIWIWTLNAYAVYHFIRSRKRKDHGVRTMGEKIGNIEGRLDAEQVDRDQGVVHRGVDQEERQADREERAEDRKERREDREERRDERRDDQQSS